MAFTAKVDQTITVSGKLSPISSVTVIESPSSGVVKSVLLMKEILSIQEISSYLLSQKDFLVD